MLKTLEIKNFKSIKHLKLECKRINVFIGEPNTGKSNILECLGLLSCVSYGGTGLNEFIRYENIINLFYDLDVRNDIVVTENDRKTWELKFKDGKFQLFYENQLITDLDSYWRFHEA